MWLLNTTTLTLEFFTSTKAPPHPYVILSHVWETDEVLFEQVQESQPAIQTKKGWLKVKRFCALALDHGFAYAWVDTCCIDKRSSVELSEALNSMYKYYYDAAVCYIYLADVPSCVPTGSNSSNAAIPATREQLLASVRASRWFSRGWTLQELLVPSRRSFWTADWIEIEGGDDLLNVLAEASAINQEMLQDRDLLPEFCIAERMKWASKRETTREEDIAYCLMGIFNVSMPILYGEGAVGAFKRLQTEIIRNSFDMTIFAWRADYANSGCLARSPADFASIPPLDLLLPSDTSFSMTSMGLALRTRVSEMSSHLVVNRKLPGNPQLPDDMLFAAVWCDVEVRSGEWQVPMVLLEPVLDSSFHVNGQTCQGYRRIRCLEWVTVPFEELACYSYKELVILEDKQYDMTYRLNFFQ
ncbi:HET-domain-containing protein [Durotheca rogersii]|uniref:HET-domain-containing protein n=1 Tax=Durotheca rogersii TaxID=419775 RepID=UPI00221F6BD8|nr:HET-domain-containing protein [Durotheca rogersii]KAI5866564.1 HET-domain-containing protein [Durotheca rogersii]